MSIDMSEAWTAYWADRTDPEPMDQLLRAYAELAGFYARMALAKAPAHQDRDDILSYAQHGLLQAIQKYEPGHGATFETWARRIIPRRIMDRQRSDDPLTRGMRGKVKLISEAQQTLWIERRPSLAELADYAQMTEGEVREILLFQQTLTSELDLDHGGGVESEGEVLVRMAEARAYVAARMADLQPRQRAFALTYYCDTVSGDKTLVQACRELGISADWARQTRNQVLKSLQR